MTQTGRFSYLGRNFPPRQGLPNSAIIKGALAMMGIVAGAYGDTGVAVPARRLRGFG
jgi:hypothetical protein